VDQEEHREPQVHKVHKVEQAQQGLKVMVETQDIQVHKGQLVLVGQQDS
jgi:hypothetical protein